MDQPKTNFNVQGSVNIWAVVATAVITAVIAGGVTYYFQKTAFEMEKQSLQEQINQLQTQISRLEEKQAVIQPITQECETGDRVYFEIKEMGIKFLVDKDIKNDLEYQYFAPNKMNAGWGICSLAYFSTKSLSLMDSECLAKNGSVYAVMKCPGQPSDAIYGGFGHNPVKQFDNFFIENSTPNGVCSSDQKVNEYVQKIIDKMLAADNKDCILLVN